MSHRFFLSLHDLSDIQTVIHLSLFLHPSIMININFVNEITQNRERNFVQHSVKHLRQKLSTHNVSRHFLRCITERSSAGISPAGFRHDLFIEKISNEDNDAETRNVLMLLRSISKNVDKSKKSTDLIVLEATVPLHRCNRRNEM